MKEDKYLKDVCNKVKEALMKKGLSIRVLGELCEMDYSNLSRFENGQHDINMLTLKKISEQLKIDIRKLL